MTAGRENPAAKISAITHIAQKRVAGKSFASIAISIMCLLKFIYVPHVAFLRAGNKKAPERPTQGLFALSINF
jgi:hypothetical protein